MLGVEQALHTAIQAEIVSHEDDASLALYEVKLLSSQFGVTDFNEADAFVRISVAQFYRNPFQTQEMLEYNVLVYLEAIVRPQEADLESEDEALYKSTEIMTYLQDFLRDSDLGGSCSMVDVDSFPFQRGMSNRGGRFGVTVLPLYINPMGEG